jgi:DNA polymerase III delta prime subunit
MDDIPWVEKYRPTQFDDIVLDPINRDIFKNILNQNYFPNVLFYGPPGTGKTTTIINLINEYNKRYSTNSKGTIIHLNASDERGIDIIRNQIYQFVKSSNFFEVGLKFVILDEVDYMTKNAQHALKYLLQTSSYNVRYCLICNYISKIDESLKNEFLCIRFNQLPKQDIYQFITNISDAENLRLDQTTVHMIQELHNSDIRSMINFMQLNRNTANWEHSLLTNDQLIDIQNMILSREVAVSEITTYIHKLSIQYNTDKITIVKKFVNYIIRYCKPMLSPEFFNIISIVMHINTSNIENTVVYLVSELRKSILSK